VIEVVPGLFERQGVSGMDGTWDEEMRFSRSCWSLLRPDTGAQVVRLPRCNFRKVVLPQFSTMHVASIHVADTCRG